ncbi:diiron oxygenase [Sandaracinus amylolyticus]|uniref:Putative membrane protein n=1 Tax=Sandaracinus amylolyticus TaxID=927083 RepID=A0A0F6W4C9_9BACT|nr:diiron oxygenase [Sandaracinus amylolyticus]AKF07175.1 putative membrane protein [Sandaracinus amylolyticus]
MQTTTTVPQSSMLAEQLTKASRKGFWDVYSYFQWPESLPDDAWYMSPELISIYGTELWERMTEAQQKKLSLFEIGNFFSLTLQGERPLVAGMSDLLYSSKMTPQATEYLHHFIDEENKHMIMFGIFCHRYLGKVYPEKKIALPREYAKGEAEVTFFCKVMVVEELGDYYNVVMQRDKRIHSLIQEINFVHHRDEARHLGFGREFAREMWEKHSPSWPPEVLTRFRSWLAQYLKSSWADFYNPSMYRDAGITRDSGLGDPYEVRQMALAHPKCLEHREKASKKLITYFLRNGMLTEAPAL